MTAVEIRVPDIGDFAEVAVIELLVKPGDAVQIDQSLITVESDKASMEIPSSAAGVLESFVVKFGDRVSEGSLIARLRVAENASLPGNSVAPQDGALPSYPDPQPAPQQVAYPGVNRHERLAADMPEAAVDGRSIAAGTLRPEPAATVRPEPMAAHRPESVTAHRPEPAAVLDKPHASPSVRKFARELGVELLAVIGSGPKGRITQADVQAHVKRKLRSPLPSEVAPEREALSPAASVGGLGSVGGAGLALLPWPQIDFSKFGDVERKPLARIKKISGANLHRNWVMIPHVTQHDEVDISELETLRVQLNHEQGKDGTKITMLAFLIKAVVHALRHFPEFNASLDGEELVLKKYAHIGFAADTPNGLVVPVLREADRKGIYEIARETSELAAKAREGRLSPPEMQGGSMSISSLGGIGGGFFTPIINAPEVAILGVGRSLKKPHWDEGGERFVPRLILPLSLSYDHRVIDGAAAARFITHIGRLLNDFRRIAL
jgi:pyruvate dehydrogenase E2 component (dihydrolipoamide acetyltransferase)